MLSAEYVRGIGCVQDVDAINLVNQHGSEGVLYQVNPQQMLLDMFCPVARAICWGLMVLSGCGVNHDRWLSRPVRRLRRRQTASASRPMASASSPLTSTSSAAPRSTTSARYFKVTL